MQHEPSSARLLERKGRLGGAGLQVDLPDFNRVLPLLHYSFPAGVGPFEEPGARVPTPPKYRELDTLSNEMR